ncbi:hypothetical protein [Undibacterium sp. TJN19]|uniref:hypothetical protein n=1 Tax=Undibacterium sp. TJN19 TaxID=3413055 RepID=UPI003BF09FDC
MAAQHASPARLLGRPVEAVAVPRHEWEAMLISKGFPPASALAFAEMFDGFNSGHIAFDGEMETRYGKVTLETALKACLGKRH